MTWNTIQNSTTMDPADVNENFYHVAQGSVTPKGGTSMGSTAGVYDLGSSTYRWDTLYCDSVNNDDGYIWESISLTDVTVGTSRIEVTGLTNGLEYMILVYGVINTATAIYLNPNGDSTANYGLQMFQYAAARTVLDSVASEIQVGDASTNHRCLSKTIFYAGVNNERAAIVQNVNSALGGTIASIEIRCYSYAEVSNTITSMVFTSNAADNMGVGTYIQIWQRGRP